MILGNEIIRGNQINEVEHEVEFKVRVQINSEHVWSFINNVITE